METDRYHYQKVLSDIAGQDIASHHDDPQTLTLRVRNWLSDNTDGATLPSASQIWHALNQFNGDLITNLSPTYAATEIAEMPIGDYIKFAKAWLTHLNV